MAITVMVAALVGAFSYVYLSQLVRSRLFEAYNDGQFILHEIQNSAREVVDNTDLGDTRVDTENPQEVKKALRDALQGDPGLNTLLESIVGYSPMLSVFYSTVLCLLFSAMTPETALGPRNLLLPMLIVAVVGSAFQFA